MATQEEKELRQKVLKDIKRKRAAAAQAEGSVRAAEEGQYGDWISVKNIKSGRIILAKVIDEKKVSI